MATTTDAATLPQIMRCRTCNAPRSKSPCHKCGGDLFLAHVDWEEPEIPDIEAIRSLARQKGYAIGVHGSLERDVDLIAAPWTEDACGPKELAAFIAAGINGRVVAPEEKPLGRWSCNIQTDGWFKLIDLSVAPRAHTPPPAPAITREELVGMINRELRSYELHGGNILDAIATYHNDKTVKEALETVGDWSAWLADAILSHLAAGQQGGGHD